MRRRMVTAVYNNTGNRRGHASTLVFCCCFTIETVEFELILEEEKLTFLQAGGQFLNRQSL